MTSSCGQITPEQNDFAEQGIKTIINNRPDGEAPDQPTSEAIAEACEQAGVAYKEISFAGNALTNCMSKNSPSISTKQSNPF